MQNEQKQKAIIVDLDGTLCDISHRLHYIQQDKPNWKAFNSKILYDKVNHWCRKIIHFFAFYDYTIIFLTGREGNKQVIGDTLRWLEDKKCNINFKIEFRPEGDYRPDHVIKKEYFEKQIKDFYDVLFVIEDRDRVVEMWRESGLTCLQCAKGTY